MIAMGKSIWPGPSAEPTPWNNWSISTSNGPSAPSGVNANTAQAAKIRVTWNSVSGAQSYNVKRRESSSEEWWTVKFFVEGTEFIDEDLDASKTYQYCVSSNGVQYEGPNSGSASQSPSTGLIAQWNFDEISGQPAESESPSGMRNGVVIESADASITGTVNQNVDGIEGKGISFDGYGHVSIPVALNFALGRTGSVSAWMKTQNGETDVPSILGAIGSDSSDEMKWGYVDSTGNIAFDFSGTVLTGGQVNDGSWHHIAMTRDQQSGQVQLFVDGVRVGNGTDGTFQMERARVFRIGGSTIDEVKVYNRVLGNSEIADLATPPNGGGGGGGGTATFAEAESLSRTASTASANANHDDASGGVHVHVKSKALGEWVEFSINAPSAGTYDIVSHVRKRNNSAIWQLSVGGVNVGLPQDFYFAGNDWVDIQFGTATLTAGTNILRFQNTGKNTASYNYMAYFDSFTLLPTTNSEQFEEVENLTTTASVSIVNISQTSASNGLCKHVKSKAVNEWFEMTVDVDQAGSYDIIMGVRERFNAGIWQMSIDGSNLGSPIDMYTGSQNWTEYVFGTLNLSAGTHTFRLTTTGKNSSSSNYMGYFDTLILSPAGGSN